MILARRTLLLGTALACSRMAGAQPARTLQVGPARSLKTIAAAAREARDGDTIEIDAGDYRRDVAVWTQDRLTLRAVGGRVHLQADGESAEDKAIWVMRGGRMAVQGFDFEGTRVPARNGAGIRFESGHLTVSDCRFLRNEMGLLTSNDPAAELTIVDSEFAYNKREDGHDHNLYAGHIARLSVQGSYFHHATPGHLLKSRAAVSDIRYNRLTDEDGGRASYELEFPNGGVALVIGNIIQQGPLTENPILVSYGAEGYGWPRNALMLMHNTLVDDLPAGGTFLHVQPGEVTVRALNNVLTGPAGGLDMAPGEYHRNVHVAPQAYANAPAHDYRLRAGSDVLGLALPCGSFDGLALDPTRVYRHPCSTAPLAGAASHPGALQALAPRSGAHLGG